MREQEEAAQEVASKAVSNDVDELAAVDAMDIDDTNLGLHGEKSEEESKPCSSSKPRGSVITMISSSAVDGDETHAAKSQKGVVLVRARQPLN